MEYKYWILEYLSCEGNERWTIARSPIDWDHHDVKSNITLGGCGDDVAQVTAVTETIDEYSDDYYWDFCN